MNKQDAFGEALLRQYEDLDRDQFVVIERDDGYIEADDVRFYFNEAKDFSETEKQIMELAYGRVLDIGCGAGRHALYLQNVGADVTGIDNSPGAVRVSKKRGVKKIKLQSIDQLQTFKPNSFDTILMMGNNFGLFGSPAKAKTLLKKIATITSADAQIIAENMDPYKTRNIDHVTYHQQNKKRGRNGGQIKFRIRFKKNTGPWFDYLFVSIPELKSILSGTGWKLSKLIKTNNPGYVAIIKKMRK